MPPFARQFPLDNGSVERLDDAASLSRIAHVIDAELRGITLDFQVVRTDAIIPLCKFVFKERLLLAQKLVEQYAKQNISLFCPVSVSFSSGQKQLIAPPILERRDGKYILCDGMHRVYVARQCETVNLKCLVIDRITIPLPGKPQSWGAVRVSDVQLPVERNFEDFRPEFLTWYTKAFNGLKAFSSIA
jgi:hypothetical protein